MTTILTGNIDHYQNDGSNSDIDRNSDTSRSDVRLQSLDSFSSELDPLLLPRQQRQRDGDEEQVVILFDHSESVSTRIRNERRDRWRAIEGIPVAIAAMVVLIATIVFGGSSSNNNNTNVDGNQQQQRRNYRPIDGDDDDGDDGSAGGGWVRFGRRHHRHSRRGRILTTALLLIYMSILIGVAVVVIHLWPSQQTQASSTTTTSSSPSSFRLFSRLGKSNSINGLDTSSSSSSSSSSVLLPRSLDDQDDIDNKSTLKSSSTSSTSSKDDSTTVDDVPLSRSPSTKKSIEKGTEIVVDSTESNVVPMGKDISPTKVSSKLVPSYASTSSDEGGGKSSSSIPSSTMIGIHYTDTTTSSEKRTSSTKQSETPPSSSSPPPPTTTTASTSPLDDPVPPTTVMTESAAPSLSSPFDDVKDDDDDDDDDNDYDKNPLLPDKDTPATGVVPSVVFITAEDASSDGTTSSTYTTKADSTSFVDENTTESIITVPTNDENDGNDDNDNDDDSLLSSDSNTQEGIIITHNSSLAQESFHSGRTKKTKKERSPSEPVSSSSTSSQMVDENLEDEESFTQEQPPEKEVDDGLASSNPSSPQDISINRDDISSLSNGGKYSSGDESATNSLRSTSSSSGPSSSVDTDDVIPIDKVMPMKKKHNPSFKTRKKNTTSSIQHMSIPIDDETSTATDDSIMSSPSSDTATSVSDESEVPATQQKLSDQDGNENDRIVNGEPVGVALPEAMSSGKPAKSKTQTAPSQRPSVSNSYVMQPSIAETTASDMNRVMEGPSYQNAPTLNPLPSSHPAKRNSKVSLRGSIPQDPETPRTQSEEGTIDHSPSSPDATDSITDAVSARTPEGSVPQSSLPQVDKVNTTDKRKGNHTMAQKTGNDSYPSPAVSKIHKDQPPSSMNAVTGSPTIENGDDQESPAISERPYSENHKDQPPLPMNSVTGSAISDKGDDLESSPADEVGQSDEKDSVATGPSYSEKKPVRKVQKSSGPSGMKQDNKFNSILVNSFRAKLPKTDSSGTRPAVKVDPVTPEDAIALDSSCNQAAGCNAAVRSSSGDSESTGTSLKVSSDESFASEDRSSDTNSLPATAQLSPEKMPGSGASAAHNTAYVLPPPTTETPTEDSGSAKTLPVRSPKSKSEPLDYVTPTSGPSSYVDRPSRAVAPETASNNHKQAATEDLIQSESIDVPPMNGPHSGVLSQEMASPTMAGVSPGDQLPESLHAQLQLLRSWLQTRDGSTVSIPAGIHSIPDDAATCKTEQILAGILMDEKGFFFPSNVECPNEDTSRSQNHYQQQHHENHDRRDKKAVAGDIIVDWSIDTEKHQKDAAALGEYYRGKGMALVEYYSQSSRKDDKRSSRFRWSSDWKEDVQAGIALGRTYEAIGELVNAHYQEAFHHADSNGSDRSCQSYLMSYTWKTDWGRGLDLVEYFSQLADIISSHYDELYDERIAASTSSVGNQKEGHASHQHNDNHENRNPCDWDRHWKEYTLSGRDLSDYYRNKCLAIMQFYSGENSNDDKIWESRKSMESSFLASSLTLAEGSVRELTTKGKAVGNYYSAVFDPLYRTNTLSSLPSHNPDHDFPRWGVSHKADQEHGVALGEYWRQYNEIMKGYYDNQGMDLVHHYETYFSDVLFGLGEYPSSHNDERHRRHDDDVRDKHITRNDDRQSQHARRNDDRNGHH